jgi:hypothetical protein
MITYRHEKRRHVLSMTNQDLADLAEVIWLLKHTPPPMGYQRKPMTGPQQKIVDNLYDIIGYPADYAALINSKTGQ